MLSNGTGKPVIALDIDGTLGDYHGHFLCFASGWFGQEFPSAALENPGLPLWEFMGVERSAYRECKLAYRQGGLKRTMPIYDGAAPMTNSFRMAGAEVWLCTTRPYLRLDNIDPDTREWLRRNGVEYDAVLFDTLEGKGTKYDELRRQAGSRVVLIVDDLPAYLTLAYLKFDIEDCRFLLRDQPYNRYWNGGFPGMEWATRVTEMDEIRTAGLLAIHQWQCEERNANR